MSARIEIRGLHKTYGGFEALRGIDLDVAAGEVVVVVGPSGSGKSTLIQSFNLFPHLTAWRNVALAPQRVRGLPRRDAELLARTLLDQVGLSSQADKLPGRLSGGQQQRVAIARALAMEPRVLLFDEPTSALDPEMVGEVLAVIQGLAHTGVTMLIVTHEMGFARRVADRIVFMEAGSVVEQAAPEEFFTAPREARTRAFLQAIVGH